jgi:hypothetical protein
MLPRQGIGCWEKNCWEVVSVGALFGLFINIYGAFFGYFHGNHKDVIGF